jgi:membrane protein CcdC involved in cytochrome C biogenesis
LNTRGRAAKISSWLVFNIILPVLPIFFGFVVVYLQATKRSYIEILDGAELFFLSLVLLSSTKNDIDNSEINLKSSTLFSILSIILFPFILFSGFLFVLAYVNDKISDIRLDRSTLINTAIITTAFVTLMSSAIQIYLIFVKTHIYRQISNREEQDGF